MHCSGLKAVGFLCPFHGGGRDVFNRSVTLRFLENFTNKYAIFLKRGLTVSLRMEVCNDYRLGCNQLDIAPVGADHCRVGFIIVEHPDTTANDFSPLRDLYLSEYLNS